MTDTHNAPLADAARVEPADAELLRSVANYYALRSDSPDQPIAARLRALAGAEQEREERLQEADEYLVQCEIRREKLQALVTRSRIPDPLRTQLDDEIKSLRDWIKLSRGALVTLRSQ